MPRRYFRPIRDVTIVSVLHYLRSVIVRDGLEGVEHVDALLGIYGVDPASLPIPMKRPKHFGRSGLRRAILVALRDGPLTGAELARRVGGNLEPRAAYKRTYAALAKMKAAGLVRHEGRLWSLVIPAAASNPTTPG